MHKLTAAHLEEHINKTFCGKNFAVVASGDVDHNKVVDTASHWLNQLSVEPKQIVEFEKAYMTPSMISQRDDEMDNANIAISYITPEYSSPHSLTARIWKEILGDYNASQHGTAHLNTANR